MVSENLSSVRRALDVLRALGQGPLGVQEVAGAVGREKTQVSRTLKVLAEEGFIERDPRTLRYRVGQAAAGARRVGGRGPVAARGPVRTA